MTVSPTVSPAEGGGRDLDKAAFFESAEAVFDRFVPDDRACPQNARRRQT